MGHYFSLKNWLKELATPYDYCLSLMLSAGPDNKSGLQILKTRKNQIYSLHKKSQESFHSSVIFSRLKYSFFSPMLFAETMTVKCRKKSLLDFTVRHHIKKLSLFDPDFHFCYDLLSFNGENAIVNIYVLPATDAQPIMRAIPHAEKPVSCLVPLEYVITELLSNTVSNPVVSVWADHKQVLLLTTKGKEILSRNVYTHDCDENEIAQWLDTQKILQHAMTSAKAHDPEQKASLLLWGDHYQTLQRYFHQHPDLRIDKSLEQKISNKLEWKGNFAGKLQHKALSGKGIKKGQQGGNSAPTGKDIYKEAIFTNPGLFGLGLSKKSQSFISLDYKYTYTKFMRSRYALIASLIACTGFATIGAYNYSAQIAMETEIFQNYASIKSGIQQVNARIPDEKKLQDTVEKARLKIAMSSELNVTNFLGWLTNIAPDKAIIDQLQIEVITIDLAPKTKNSKKSTALEKQYSVELNLKIDRTYSDSVAQIDTFFSRLSERVKSPESKFVYLDANDKVPSALALKFIVEPRLFL